MDPVVIQIISQIPVLAICVLAILMFVSIRRERKELQELREMGPVDTGTSSADRKRLEALLQKVEETRDEVDKSLNRLHESDEFQDRIASQASNQKTALKEFGRVLSRTSEQIYTELQAQGSRIADIEQAMVNNGLLSNTQEAA